jgi:PRTRC genetic system ThiF family protein
MAELTVSCVDTVKARFDIAALLTGLDKKITYMRNRPLYWLDFGNSKDTGQVILSTLNAIEQPQSKKWELLETSETADQTPSCTLAEALSKQDLFINSALANLGSSLLWQIFREGMLFNRGFFLNLKELKTQPL